MLYEMNNNLKLSKTELRYCTWNVRSLSQLGKLELVAKALDIFNVDIACLQETRFKNNDTVTVSPPESDNEFVFYSSMGTSNGQQGVTIAIQSWFRELVLDWNPISSRIALLTLDAKPNPVSVVATYAPTNAYSVQERQDYYQLLQSVICSIPRRNFLIVGGDMNAQLSARTPQIGAWAIGQQCSNGDFLEDFVSQNRLCVANTIFQHKRSRLVTWVSPDQRTKNQIDYVLVRERWRSSVLNCRTHWAACNTAKSDHAPVIATVKLRLRVKRKANKFRNLALEMLKQPDTSNRYNTELKNRFSLLENLPDDIDETWSSINQKIMGAAESCLTRRRRSKKKWISSGTMDLVRAKNRIPTASHARRKAITKAIDQHLQEDHENYWSSVATSMEQANNVGDSKKLFRLIKESLGKSSTVSDVLRDHSGNNITVTSEKLDHWKEYFENLLNRPAPPGGYKQFLPATQPVYQTSIDPPSADEVLAAINKLKCNKAAGKDDINPELLKAGSPTLVPILVDLFRKMWELEKAPSDWNLSVIIPLFKKGDKTDCRNYRGISLQSLVSKVFENVLLSRFRACRDTRTRESQAGFRPGRGCCDQIFTLRRILEWRHEFRMPTAVAFLDFTAAFDSLDRSAVWDLIEADGMPPKLLNLIKALYKNTKAAVRVYSSETAPFNVRTGVRQGAITSPVIFNYAIDWVLASAIAECERVGYRIGISTGSDYITDTSYADDISILADGEEELDYFTKQIARFGSLIGMSISVKKSKVIACCMTPPKVTIDTEALENVDSFAYLGSNMNANGSSEKEIPQRIGRASGVFNSFHHCLWSKIEIGRNTKIRVYKASVLSVLLYASECWAPRKEDEIRLDAFHHTCLRRILGIRWEDHISNARVRLLAGMPETIAKIIQKKRLKYLGHILRMNTQRLPRISIFASAPNDWKRPVGGVKMTWRRLVNRETRPLTNHIRFRRGNRQSWDPGGTEWLQFLEEIAANREQWKSVCDAMVQETGRSSRILP